MLEPGSIPAKGQRLVPNLAVSTTHGRAQRADLQGERARLAPELAAECVSTSSMAAGFAVGAQCMCGITHILSVVCSDRKFVSGVFWPIERE